ncbi:MAG TPA: PLP-dependent aspartate aminotransferase family protein [Chitinophagaceae bacterium]|jgi:methionine-gamma-lyase|nr:PLP-dependent aspartate aminotransferase family protein [Chitinophagaceae bacterium]
MEKEFNVSGWSSLAIHAGHEENDVQAHLTPIYASSTFVYDSAEQGMRRFSGEEKGYIYSRWGNPTFSEAERKIEALETFGLNLEVKGILHASGMAAISTVLLSCLKSGDKVLSHFSLYGGTEELTQQLLPGFGIERIIMDLRDLNKAEEVMKSDAAIKLLYIETPANPTIQCVDIEELSNLAKKYHIKVVVDNTFATPYLQQPFKYDVDFVIHSTTKFLNGHGTTIGGILLGKDIELMNTQVKKTHKMLGGNTSPFDAFLLTQGIKTLEIRMKRHCYNAIEIANYLYAHNAVGKVNYLGLTTHPDFETAQKQMRHAGPMLSFELKNGLQDGINFMNRLKMCVRTVSLGTVDTLLSHPASMTHYGVGKEERIKYGITDGLIRMNVGIENLEDIIKDLEQALKV